MTEQGSDYVRIAEMRKELAATWYQASMGRRILRAHKVKMLKLVAHTLDKRWKTWSTHAAKLQLLRADRDNTRAHSQGFLKMSEEVDSVVHEDLARDLYELAAIYWEEISQLMEEFDAHDIDTSVQLDGYERKRQQPTNELGVLGAPQTQPPQTNDVDNDANFTDTEQEQEDKLSLYDIL